MMTESLTVEEYQDLIDRGWRRSGKYCYKPTMDKTCCPQYTIRCNTTKFSLNKSHKKIIKKCNKFLTNGILYKNQSENLNNQEDSINEHPEHRNQQNNKLDLSQIKVNNSLVSSSEQSFGNNIKSSKLGQKNFPGNDDADNRLLKKSSSQKSIEEMVIGSSNSSQGEPSEVNNLEGKSCKPGSGADPTKPPCKKAKLLRLERKKQKLLQKSPSKNLQDLQSTRDSSKNNVQKNLSQYLEETPSNGKHKLKLTLVPTTYECEEWERTKATEYELYKKYQMLVHNDPEDKLSMGSFCRFLVSSPLKIDIVKMERYHPSFNQTAFVYQKYQLKVHNDHVTDSDFIEFLVSTPLKPKKFPGNVEGPGYGSFHQQYWLDDKLISVGVIDILPSCVSSVYYFYDPDYRDLSLGTYGSLREIQLVQNLSETLPDLRYYYMGFYIHSCPKMRYKGKLVPSDLLCPETYVWVPIEKCFPKLDVSKYSRLSEDPEDRDQNSCSQSDINNIKIIFSFKMMTVKDFVRHFDGDMDIFRNLGKLVGKKSSSSIIFWIE